MATIGTIATKMVMKSAPFESGARRASGMLNNMGASGISGAKGLGILAAGAAAAAIVIKTLKAVIGQVVAAMTEIDHVAKTADILGIAVDKMVAYSHGAKRAGITTTEFETGLRRMEKNVSDANEGLSTAKRSFDQLGISAAKMEALTPDEQLKVLAEAMNKVESQSDKARIAQDLFGRSGLKLIKFFEGGAEGLDDMEAKAAALGITFSRLDAAQVEKANDAITDMKAAFGGIFNQLAIELAPAIEEMSNWVVSMVQDALPFFKELFEIVGKIAKAFIGVGKILGEIVIELIEWHPIMIAWRAFNKPLEGIRSFFGIGGNKELAADAGADAGSAGIPDAALEVQAAQIDEKLMDAGKGIFNSTRTPAEKFAANMADWTRLLEVGAINQDTFNRAVMAGRKELENAAASKVKVDEAPPPRLGATASSPAALSGAEAANQFLANQRGTQGDPIARLMKQQHDLEIEKLEAIRVAVEQQGANAAIF